MCIYLGNDSRLTYNSQEHIFPASIGGREMLTKGMVSDQANNYFSKLEKNLVQLSLVEVPRSLEGIGSRGSSKPGDMNISIFKINDTYALGFVFDKRPILIPTLSINLPNINFWTNNDGNQNAFLNFLDQATNFSNKYVFIENEALNNEILFGCYKEKFFIAAKNKNIIVPEKIKKVLIHLKEKNTKPTNIKTGQSFPIVHQVATESEDNAKVYAKIALNVIAKLKGEEFLMDPQFKPIKEWILKDKEFSINWLPNNNPLENVFPQAHQCILSNISQGLCAYVSLFGISRTFIISKIMDPYFDEPKGFFCDYKNKKEFTLDDYYMQLAKANNP